MAQAQNDFSKGSIPRNIMALALPMTAAQLVNVLYSVVDRIYLGRLPGTSHLALTGIGVTIPIVSIIMGLANLCGTGGAPLCSISRGHGDNEEAERVMGNAFTLLLILGAAATAFFFLLKEPILYLFGASTDTFVYADQYMTIYLCGTLFVMISLGMNPFINSQGFGRVGKALSQRLAGLGARVSVSARSWADLALAESCGYRAEQTEHLAGWLCGYDLVVNTVPAPVLGLTELSDLKPGCLVIDLASKPGGVDFGAAARLGVKVIWALSLPGKVAPVTAGECIQTTIYNIMRELGV